MSTTNTPVQANLAFVFPGQGSQSIGMMAELGERFEAVGRRFDQASAVLGFDLWALAQNGPEDELNATRNTQPALLAASVATWDIWLAEGGPRPGLMAGHSFGEYSALVCAGALDFETAVGVVADRGRFMQEAVPVGEGAMAAILGLDAQALGEACAAATDNGAMVCSPANLNAPGQIVIAGHAQAVDRACQLAKDKGAKRAVPLAVSAPAHCALMTSAAEKLAARLDAIELGAPDTPVIHNVDVAPHEDPFSIRAALVGQMTAPVRWIETIESFAASGVTAVCECGPGKVLSSLVKRINKGTPCHALGTPEALDAALNA